MDVPSRSYQTVLQYLSGLKPALPFSTDAACKPMSGQELRRLCEQGGVLINTERVAPTELVDFPVFSLVFYPSGKRRTTLV